MENEITQLQNQVQELQKQIAHLNDLYFRTNFVDKTVFTNPVYFNGATNFKNAIGSSGGTLGFYGHALVARQTTATTPSGGGSASTDAIDISARTAIGQIKTALTNLGLTN